MKGTLYILFLSLAMVLSSNEIYSQQTLLTLNMEQRTIKDMLTTIEKQSEYVFFFSDDIKPELERTMSISVEKQGIEQILDRLFSTVDLSYSIKGRQINIYSLNRESGSVNQKNDPPITLYSGTIFDYKGESLTGVNIRIEGHYSGITTDSLGNFSFYARVGSVAEFSYMGYLPKKVKLNQDNKLLVFLFEDERLINEVVVIGYGSVQKKDLTGSVTNIKVSDIKDIPVLSVDRALQGRVAGMDILSTTGEPGAKTSIRIRGTRSITATNEPLIVIDGIMDGVHDLNDVNTADIESVTVLKDASATAIYGSRGSNGVIIITTKKGVAGKPRISLKSSFGFSALPDKLDLMNASEFAQFRNDFAYFATTDNYAHITGSTPQSQYPYPDPIQYGKGTDWIEEVTRIAPYQNHSLSVSGGSSLSNYFASFSYNNTEGIIKESGIKRYTGRLNLEHQLFSWMKLGFKYNYTYRDERPNIVGIGGTNYGNNVIFLSPLLTSLEDFNNLYGDTGGQKFNNPVHRLENVHSVRNRKFSNKTAYFEIKPLKGLLLNNISSYYTYQRHTYRYEAASLPLNTDKGGKAVREEYEDLSLSNETTLSYQQNFSAGHHADGMLGVVYSKINSNNLSAEGTGYMSDALEWNNMGAIPDKQNYTMSTNSTQKITQSFLARANYNYLSKYYLTVTGRYEGASNFAQNKKWAFFPSAALKWAMGNERYIQTIPWINELSFRLSAGRTGNAGISSYQSLDALTSTTNGYLFNGTQFVAYYPSRIASPDLSWEKTEMYNLGVDVSLFKNRINLTLEGYLSYTKDLLLSVQTAVQTGYKSHLSNLGKTSNKGLELNIETRNVISDKFFWSSAFSISHNRQRVEDIGWERFVSVFNSVGNNPYMMYGYVKGYPLNALWGFQYAGVWKTEKEVERNKVTKAYASPSYYSLGTPRFIDVNHDGALNEKDLVYLGNADPYVYGGLLNTFRYRHISVDLFFQYSLGGKIYNISEQYMGNGSRYANQYRYMVNSWHPVRNPNSDYPRAGSDILLASDRMVYDASFLRLKNLSISYQIDMKRYTKGQIRDLHLTLSGENLYLWKHYNGFDPDVSTDSSNSALRRIDNGAYPKARTILFSIQLNY